MGQRGKPFLGRKMKNYILLFRKHGGHQCAMLPISFGGRKPVFSENVFFGGGSALQGTD